ncbi:MAG: CRTAC1 family protein [Verrucomicrobia bacterium]|nr:CRTAC1 family protein [Verrucomicrobiota bacterium]MBI3870041.1 CRTAC1 family protein [Verrucomicrobiota bacterium]
MKTHLTRLAAVILVALAYPFARLPQAPSTEIADLASRFAFQRFALPEVPDHPLHKSVRNVHPSLARISAWVSSLGAAVSIADLDGDGLPNDLILVDPRTDLVTVAPVPGTGDRYKPFVLNTSFWSNRSYDLSTIAPMGTLVGDFNEDGLLDVMVYFWGRTPVIYLRKALPSPSPSVGGRLGSDPSGLRLSLDSFLPTELIDSGERWYSNAAIQSDFDGDGHVDLLVGNYFQDGSQILDAHAGGTVMMHAGKSKALNGGLKHFFLWRSAAHGAGPSVRYEEIKNVVSEELARGWTLALGAADLDGDMLPEIYIANDFGPDRLLHNRSKPGSLNFALLEGRRDFMTPKSCVLGHDSFKSMGVDFGDLNGDGLLDIYVSNIATKYALTESHFVWLSTGKTAQMKDGIAPYLHGSEKLGLARSGFAWEARLADFNNDGVLEAMQACGFIKGTINRWPELQALGTSNDQIVHNPRLWPNFRPGADLSGNDSNPFFVKGADARYHDISPALGLAEPMVSRGIAIADVDGDGLLDFITANQWGPSYLFKNHAPNAGAFLGLRLVHPNGSPAIGAVARARLPDGRSLVAQVDGGTGHSGRRSADIHFGLGALDKTKLLPLEVDWRDREGNIHHHGFQLPSGWHTIRLGGPANSIQALR